MKLIPHIRFQKMFSVKIRLLLALLWCYGCGSPTPLDEQANRVHDRKNPEIENLLPEDPALIKYVESRLTEIEGTSEEKHEAARAILKFADAESRRKSGLDKDYNKAKVEMEANQLKGELAYQEMASEYYDAEEERQVYMEKYAIPTDEWDLALSRMSDDRPLDDPLTNRDILNYIFTRRSVIDDRKKEFEKVRLATAFEDIKKILPKQISWISGTHTLKARLCYEYEGMWDEKIGRHLYEERGIGDIIIRSSITLTITKDSAVFATIHHIKLEPTHFDIYTLNRQMTIRDDFDKVEEFRNMIRSEVRHALPEIIKLHDHKEFIHEIKYRKDKSRTWTSKNGDFSVTAKFIRQKGDHIYLLLEDGSEARI